MGGSRPPDTAAKLALCLEGNPGPDPGPGQIPGWGPNPFPHHRPGPWPYHGHNLWLNLLVVDLIRVLWKGLFKRCPKWVQLSCDGKVAESLEHWRDSSKAEMDPCRALDWPSPDREFEEITFIGSYTGRRSRTWVTLTCPPPSPHPNPFNAPSARCPHPFFRTPRYPSLQPLVSQFSTRSSSVKGGGGGPLGLSGKFFGQQLTVTLSDRLN